MQGKSLLPVIRGDKKVREYALFGYHEGHCNLTDGRWVYMKAPLPEVPYHEYTLMPTHMRNRFSVEELKDLELAEPFSFTKGCRTMKTLAKGGMNDAVNFGTKLFDLETDPDQEHSLSNLEKETELANRMVELMHENDCPKERFKRFGFSEEGEVSKEMILTARQGETGDRIPEALQMIKWERGAINMYHAVSRFLGPDIDKAQLRLKEMAAESIVTRETVAAWIAETVPEAYRDMIWYFAALASRTE